MGEEYPFLARETIRVRTPAQHTGVEAALAARLGAPQWARLATRPRAQPSFALLAEAGGRPCGHALIGHERRRLGASTLDVAELALAADVPEAEAPLLAAAVAAAAGASLPLLTLRGAPAALGAYGLAPCALAWEVRLPAAGGGGRGLRPAAPADAEDLGALAAAAWAGLPLAPQRAPPDWRWLLDAPEGWLLLEDSRGRPAAYARLVGARVVEAAAADAGAARELVVALAERGAAALALPLASGVARAAALMGGAAAAGAPRADDPAELWGLVELAPALEALAAELAGRLERSRYAGWAGAVRLEGAAGAATLRCGGGRVAVEAGAGPVDVMVGALGLAGAAQLLLGYRQPADLRATGELRCADVDLGLLDVLFPAL